MSVPTHRVPDNSTSTLQARIAALAAAARLEVGLIGSKGLTAGAVLRSRARVLRTAAEYEQWILREDDGHADA